jgi:D-alanyl-D-alanine carboxypeptidase
MVFLCGLAAKSDNNGNHSATIPEAIQQIMNDSLYNGAIWGLRVVDLDTGELVYDLNPNTLLLMGSSRKIFTSMWPPMRRWSIRSA